MSESFYVAVVSRLYQIPFSEEFNASLTTKASLKS